jgi:hypothetical protein
VSWPREFTHLSSDSINQMKFFLEFIIILLSIGLPLYLMKDDFKKNIFAIFFSLIYCSYVVWPLILIHELSLNHLLDIQVDNYIAKLVKDVLETQDIKQDIAMLTRNRKIKGLIND